MFNEKLLWGSERTLYDKQTLHPSGRLFVLAVKGCFMKASDVQRLQRSRLLAHNEKRFMQVTMKDAATYS